MEVSSLIWVRMSDMGVAATWRWWRRRVGVVGGDVGRVRRVGGGGGREQVVRVLGRVRRVVRRVHHLPHLEQHWLWEQEWTRGLSRPPSAAPPRWHCKWARSPRSRWRTFVGPLMAALGEGPASWGRSEGQRIKIKNFRSRHILEGTFWGGRYFVTSVPSTNLAMCLMT